MNCIDHPLAAKQICSRTGVFSCCFPVAALTLFATLFVTAPAPAVAGPQISIPGLQSLQRKFQKRRRHKKQPAQENRDGDRLREDTLPSSPPPLPVRNPRHVEMENYLGTLTLKEPEGQKQAPKAELIIRTATMEVTRKSLSAKGDLASGRAGTTKTARSPNTPTKWKRPQRKIPDRLREEPAPKTVVPNPDVPKPVVKEELKSDRMAIAVPSAPPLPVRKPRRHPSQMAQVDWSAAVIASATTQCTTLGIEIKPLPPVRKGLCGNPAPILMPIVGSATIRPAATTSCPMAANLARWFSQSVQPLALKHFGKKVQQIRNVSSYVCRNRYGDTKTRISEHAYANALDIAHFELQGGEKISVLKDWDIGEGEPSQKSAFLHAVHKSACEHFGTVLGPDANAAHKDHFHLDKAPRKRSNYCR